MDPKKKAELSQMFEGVTSIGEEKKEEVYASYQAFAQSEYKKGDHICSNYGRANNRYWLVAYAFVIPDNEYDAFSVKVKLDRSDCEYTALLYKD